MRPIETKRLILREFKKSDGIDFFEFLADKECCYLDGGYEPETSPYSAGYKKLMKKLKKEKNERFMIELKDEGKCIGTIHLSDVSGRKVPAIELGYGVCPSYQGKGYATEALKAVIDICFNQAGIEMVVTKILSQNSASKRVAEKLGFTKEGIIHKGAKYPPLGIVDYESYYLDRKDT